MKAPKKRSRKSSSAGQRPVLQFRVHQRLYDALTERAIKNQRSISEEAGEILSNWLGDRALFPGIQQLAMLAASAFWHAGQRANGFEGYDSTDWMKDPACYRKAWIAASLTLLGNLSNPENRKERGLAVVELAQALTEMDRTSEALEVMLKIAELQRSKDQKK